MGPARWFRAVVIMVAALSIASVLVWQGITAAGNPDPTAPGTTLASGSLDIAVLVFREGLESILVLAAVLAGLRAKDQVYRRAIYAGMGVGFGAGIASWFVAVSVVTNLTTSYGALAVQATTGLLAVVVLLIVMNWFFHNIYWSGWISMQNRRKQTMIEEADKTGRAIGGVLLGLGVLGFASVYRESVEIVLFLQSYYLHLGSHVVYYGAAGGLVLTAATGWLTLVEGNRLPYKKMLVATGALLTGVLFVMVGEQVNEMQLAGWVGTTNIPWLQGIPAWAGTWFSIFPNVQTFEGQALAILIVAGSYTFHRFWTFRGWNPSESDLGAPPRTFPGVRSSTAVANGSGPRNGTRGKEVGRILVSFGDPKRRSMRRRWRLPGRTYGTANPLDMARARTCLEARHQ